MNADKATKNEKELHGKDRKKSEVSERASRAEIDEPGIKPTGEGKKNTPKEGISSQKSTQPAAKNSVPPEAQHVS